MLMLPIHPSVFHLNFSIQSQYPVICFLPAEIDSLVQEMTVQMLILLIYLQMKYCFQQNSFARHRYFDRLFYQDKYYIQSVPNLEKYLTPEADQICRNRFAQRVRFLISVHFLGQRLFLKMIYSPNFEMAKVQAQTFLSVLQR